MDAEMVGTPLAINIAIRAHAPNTHTMHINIIIFHFYFRLLLNVPEIILINMTRVRRIVMPHYYTMLLLLLVPPFGMVLGHIFVVVALKEREPEKKAEREREKIRRKYIKTPLNPPKTTK